MCKIMVIAGLKPENTETNWEFIQELGLLMSKNNDDGLGYSAVDEEGNLFGERWLYNDHAFDVRVNMNKEIDKFGGFLKGTSVPQYNSYGKLTDRITAITMHTRMATSAKGLINVHPFVDLSKDTSVIHNGVIQNITEADHIRSTCDSERILNQYLDKSIMKYPSRLQNMVDELKGNFACGIISRDGQGRRIIDLFRSRANLGCVYVKELDAMVFTTDVSLVNKVAKDHGFHILGRFDVTEDMLLRLDAATGKPIMTMQYRDTANVYSSAYGNTGWNNSRSYKPKSEAEVSSPIEVDDVDKKIKGLIDDALNETKTTSRTYDPLNETQAGEDGYFITKDNVWQKRRALVN
jgi:hypothetical protein